MQAYQILPGTHIDGLDTAPVTGRPLGEHEVRVRVRAVSLNYRDLMVARGDYLVTAERPIVPCSDGAGEVIATGSEVTRFRPGDRVAGIFFPDWLSGDPTPQNSARSLGGAVDGVLAEETVLHEEALVAIPQHLDFIQAATLPCAGVTAWNTLFVQGQLKPGSSVLLLGTGGVSIWALQLAKAAGLRVLITSSSDEKLERAKAMGADAVINYRNTPEWQEEMYRLTDGRGVDLVAEVGGKGTLSRSVAAVRMGGTVAIIGGVSGFDAEITPMALIGGAKKLAGIFVGNRTMFEDLNRFVTVTGLQPVVDRVFDFGDAREAYRHLEAGKHFGKVVIRVGQ